MRQRRFRRDRSMSELDRFSSRRTTGAEGAGYNSRVDKGFCPQAAPATMNCQIENSQGRPAIRVCPDYHPKPRGLSLSYGYLFQGSLK